MVVIAEPDIDKVIARINSIMPFIRPNVPIEKKHQVVEFMVMLANKYEVRFPVNLRTFVHCLNIRISNELKINVGGEQMEAWVMLIKQYFVKKVK